MSKSHKGDGENKDLPIPLQGRRPEEDLELWKHYASAGGEDKNRMVTIATFLLGGSAAILWYILTNQICPDKLCNLWPLKLKHPVIVFLVAILGMGVSNLAAYVSLLYGGYSNRNWEKADKIADYRGWYDLSLLAKTSPREGMLNRIATTFAKPCDPTKELAPVFQAFFVFSMFLYVVHLFFVCFKEKVVSA